MTGLGGITAVAVLALAGIASPASATGVGARIAYVAPDASNVPQIWTSSPNGQDATQLTHDPNGDSDPAFSPDGHYIAFVNGSGHIAVMDAAGAAVVDLTPHDAPGGRVDGWPSWSPDGLKLAFTRIDYGAASPEFDVWVTNRDGTQPRNLTPGAGIDSIEPAWSPKGSSIAFVRGNPEQIWTMGTNGSSAAQLSNVDFYASDPAWSPDGSRLVFSQNVGGSDSDLWLIDATGQNQRQLTNSAALEEEASTWLPDGTSIITRAQVPPDGAIDLYAVDPSGGSEQKIANTTGADHPTATKRPSLAMTFSLSFPFTKGPDDVEFVSGAIKPATSDHVCPLGQQLNCQKHFPPNRGPYTFTVGVIPGFPANKYLHALLAGHRIFQGRITVYTAGGSRFVYAIANGRVTKQRELHTPTDGVLEFYSFTARSLTLTAYRQSAPII